LCLYNDRIRAGFDQRPGLFFVSGPGLLLRQVAVRFQNRTEWTEVPKHITFAPGKRFARDADSRLVDGAQVISVVVPPQHDPASSKGIGDDAIRARVRVTPLNGLDTFGVREIPNLATGAAFEAGQHQLSAHRAVANETAFQQGFLK
jgi:hypothetical protein